MSLDAIVRKLRQGEYRSEAEASGSDFGKWSQPGVPHTGRECIGMEDLGHDNLETCQMCEFAEVRYMHTMVHPDYPGELQVGCYCAERMGTERAAAVKREREFKKVLRNKLRDAKRKEEQRESWEEQRRNWREAEQAAMAADLTWVNAANRILGAEMLPGNPTLSEWERDFVWDIRDRMNRSSEGWAGKYNLTEKQKMCFKAIYLRIVGRP
jgi:hypothetical protein